MGNVQDFVAAEIRQFKLNRVKLQRSYTFLEMILLSGPFQTWIDGVSNLEHEIERTNLCVSSHGDQFHYSGIQARFLNSAAELLLA